MEMQINALDDDDDSSMSTLLMKTEVKQSRVPDLAFAARDAVHLDTVAT